jgi:hypothetical protein
MSELTNTHSVATAIQRPTMNQRTLPIVDAAPAPGFRTTVRPKGQSTVVG